jgi:hypothetical protein
MIDLMVELMIDLDKNEELMQQYLANPQVVAESYGLNPVDIDALVSFDYETLKTRTDATGAAPKIIRMIE